MLGRQDIFSVLLMAYTHEGQILMRTPRLQNAGGVLLMRAARALEGETEFCTQTAVVMQEAMKGACAALLLALGGDRVSSAFEPAELLRVAPVAVTEERCSVSVRIKFRRM